MLEAVQAAHPEVLCGAYLDNIIFLSPSTKKAHAATKALLKAVLDEYGQSVADEVGSRKRTSRASDPAGFWYLNDNYVFENGHLHRRMSEGSIEMYGARLAERIRDEGLGPARIMRSVKGWARQRSYDPRTLDIALELLTDLGVKEDASTVGI